MIAELIKEAARGCIAEEVKAQLMFGKVTQAGYSLIPLSVYLKGSLVKVKVGLCKGKKLYDKRQAAAERDAKRQMDRAMKERY